MVKKEQDSTKEAVVNDIIFSVTLNNRNKIDLEAKFKPLEISKIVQKYQIELSNSVKLIYENELANFTSSAKIPGFRPGKVPSKIAKEKFHGSALQKTVEFLLREATAALFEKLKVEPATQPSIEIKEFNENSLIYTATVEILPQINIPDFKKIKIEKPIYDFKESDSNEFFDKLTKNNSELLPLEEGKKSSLGNFVVIDFVGSIDGEKFEGGSAKDHKLELGSKSFIDNFEEQLVGLKKGQKKTVKVTFPENYQASALAGKKAEFEVSINDILVAKPATLGEELAKKLGYADLKTLKESAIEFLKHDFAKFADTKIRKELFDKLDAVCEFDIPPSILKAEYDSVLEKLKSSNEGDKNAQKEADTMARRRVKLGLLITEFARKEKIQISQDDVQMAFRNIIESFPGDPNIVVEHYKKNPHLVEQLKGPIIEDKAVKLILNEVELVEKKYTREKLLKTIDFE